ncbi:hypothetical protein PPH41_19220, partial [Burkholderia gladioli]|nr:hypothetical protein [Burkholderia gladioli]
CLASPSKPHLPLQHRRHEPNPVPRQALAPRAELHRPRHLPPDPRIAVGGVKGDAYVGENDIARLEAGQSASFVANLPELAARRCRIDAIDKVNVATLDEPTVASVYGGPIPAEQDMKTRQIVPLQATWQVRFAGCDGDPGIGREVPGTVQLGAGRESLAGNGVRFVAAVLQREVGF